MAAPQARVDEVVHAWSYDEFMRLGMSLIPAYARDWTNHNPSDPGITLIELLAYVSEALAYRALRITPDAKLNFLRLLEGTRVSAEDILRGEPATTIDDAIRDWASAQSQSHCAVTARDFERLAVAAVPERIAKGNVLRALCVPAVDLRRAIAGDGRAGPVDEPADMSVVLAPERELPGDALDELCRHVQAALAPRCLMTTRVHVVGPVYVYLSIGCELALRPGASMASVLDAIDAALRRRFGPVLPDEPLTLARPFGRPVHLAEIAEVIDGCADVDFVEDITVWRMGIDASADDKATRVGLRIGQIAQLGVDTRLGGALSRNMRRLVRGDDSAAVDAVLLHPWELVRVRLAREAVRERMPDDLAESAAFTTGGRRADRTR